MRLIRDSESWVTIKINLPGEQHFIDVRHLEGEVLRKPITLFE